MVTISGRGRNKGVEMRAADIILFVGSERILLRVQGTAIGLFVH
jgi:hypothetical protein